MNMITNEKHGQPVTQSVFAVNVKMNMTIVYENRIVYMFIFGYQISPFMIFYGARFF